MSAAPISSPCVTVCVVDPASGLCIGCGRSLEEIGRWAAMSEVERLAVMTGLEARLVAMRSRKVRGARARARGRDG